MGIFEQISNQIDKLILSKDQILDKHFAILEEQQNALNALYEIADKSRTLTDLQKYYAKKDEIYKTRDILEANLPNEKDIIKMVDKIPKS
jgi:Tfp pilus assembly protein PilO